MATLIRGNDVKMVRRGLGLSVAQFAAVLGVHPSTVHRWEAAGRANVPIDGVAANVIQAYKARLAYRRQSRSQDARIGEEMASALLTGGALMALGLLIDHLTED